MKKQIIKGTLITIGVLVLGFAAFKLTDYLTGTLRYKYLTIKKVEYSEPPISSEEIE